MKKLCLIAVFLVSLMGFTQASQAKSDNAETTIQDVNQQTLELLAVLKQYGSDKREEAVNKTSEALMQLDQRLDQLETRIDDKWDEMDGTARKKARSTMRALHKQRIELAERFGSWKNSSASAWDHMKEGFAKAYQNLNDAWNKAKTEFDSAEK
ncbi:sll1863 family stress response protein [Methylomonas sp. MgM2]